MNIYFYREQTQAQIDELYKLYIFYPLKEGAEWRAACDPFEICADLIQTGIEHTFKRDPNLPIGDEILRRLVTRSEFLSDGSMVNGLAGVFNGPSRRWIEARKETYVALLQKMPGATPAVRAEACELLKEMGRPCQACEKPKE